MNAHRHKTLYAFGRPISEFYDLPEHINLYWKDRESVYLGVNDQVAAMYKRPQHEIVNHNDLELAVPEAAELWRAEDRAVLTAQATRLDYEDLMVRENLRVVFLTLKTPMYDSSHHCVGTFGFSYHLDKMGLAAALAFINERKLMSPSQGLPEIQHPKLTMRENQCANLAVHGKTAREIAVILGISRRTVETHLERVKHKLGCRRRSEMIHAIIE